MLSPCIVLRSAVVQFLDLLMHCRHIDAEKPLLQVYTLFRTLNPKPEQHNLACGHRSLAMREGK